VSGDDEDSGEYWDVGVSKSFSEVYGKRNGSQHQLSDFTYPEPDRTSEPYISPVSALIERYIDYLDSRLAAGQDFQKAVSETPLPDHAFEDQIQRVRSRTLDFKPDVVNELYVPSTRENVRTSVFRTTNPWIAEDTAEEYVTRYSSRWQIESEY